MTIYILLTTPTTDAGPFNLYSNIGGFTSAFATNVSKATLLGGYVATVPTGTTVVRIISIGDCTNYIDFEVGEGPIPTTSTTSTTTSTSTTSSSTTTSTSTSTTSTSTSTSTTTSTTTASPTTTTTTTTAAPTTTTTSTSTSTSTTTSTSTSTTTTTIGPLNFDVSYTCVGTITITGSNVRGGSGTGYQGGSWVFNSEAAALANTSWVNAITIAYGVGTINDTWWIVFRDSSGTKLAKSVTTDCIFTTTTTTTTAIPSPSPPIINGILYNWYAANDFRNISSSNDWRLPVNEEPYDLLTFVDPSGTFGNNIAGEYLKEFDSSYWFPPNPGANNSSKFNARGSGKRGNLGNFSNIKADAGYWSNSPFDTSTEATISLLSNSSSMFFVYKQFNGAPTDNKKSGRSIRLIKTSTSLSDGQEGTYVGNDGKVYRTICIGTQEWLADNLAETQYRNGDLIPNVTDSSTWSGLTTGARCFYDNNESNAYSI
jgi:uncharacterized protein (TIGR02145 family)